MLVFYFKNLSMMKYSFLTALLVLCSFLNAYAQSFEEALLAYREGLKLAFITAEKSPLAAEDTSKLVFFKPNKDFVIEAKVSRIKRGEIMPFNTSSNKVKYYKPFAKLDFVLDGEKQSLIVYEAQQLKKKKAYKNYLFLPFYDLTNYEETYGMGRYLDLDKRNIKDGVIIVDFNKAYNPYCAYKGGYSCPIPPKENTITKPIYAGEKTFPHPELEIAD